MSDRIRINELRAETRAPLASRNDAGRLISREVLAALLDAVEAAQAYEPLPDAWSSGDERDRLRQTLARFDFGEQPQ